MTQAERAVMLLSVPAMLTVMLHSPCAHTKNASCAPIKMRLTFCSSSRSRGAFSREEPGIESTETYGPLDTVHSEVIHTALLGTVSYSHSVTF